MTAKNIIGITVLAAAAVSAWYLANSLNRTPENGNGSGTLKTGYYVKSARILGTGEQGKLLYEIEAEYAEQQADEEIAFENVRVRYSPESSVPWTLTADEARITGNQERLRLRGHVRAISAEGFSGEITEIRTESLDLEPGNYRAETDDRVQIRVGERSVTATGMLALLRENRLELRSNVNGWFVP